MKRIILCQPSSIVVQRGHACAGDFALLDGELDVVERLSRFKFIAFWRILHEYHYKDGVYVDNRPVDRCGRLSGPIGGHQLSYRWHVVGWFPRRREFVTLITTLEHNLQNETMYGVRSMRSLFGGSFYEPVFEALPLRYPPQIRADASRLPLPLPYSPRTLQEVAANDT